MTFVGKLSASHKLLADLSLRRDRLESEASLLHYVTPEYFMFSSTNVSEEKTKLSSVSGLSRGLWLEKASKLTFTFIPHSPSANGNHVGYLN